MRRNTNYALLLLLTFQLCTQTPASAEGEEFTQTDIDFFETKVRPVLAYRYSGRDFRLTDVHGPVVKEIIA